MFSSLAMAGQCLPSMGMDRGSLRDYVTAVEVFQPWYRKQVYIFFTVIRSVTVNEV